MVQLSMTLSDLWPRFQVTTFFDIEYLRNDMRESHSYYRTSIGSHMRSITWWHFQWLWRTPNPVFKVTAFGKSNTISISNLKYRSFDSFHRTLIGNYSKSKEWYHFQWPWVISDPDFKVTTFLKSNIVKTACLKVQYYCTSKHSQLYSTRKTGF